MFQAFGIQYTDYIRTTSQAHKTAVHHFWVSQTADWSDWRDWSDWNEWSDWSDWNEWSDWNDWSDLDVWRFYLPYHGTDYSRMELFCKWRIVAIEPFANIVNAHLFSM